jgi:predicted nucleic acid-binding protein
MTSSGAESWHRLVLDTSAFSHFRHGHPAVLDHLAKAETILLPVTVLGELEAAFELSRRTKENRLALAEFLDEPFVSVLPATQSIARQYGGIFARLRRAGTPIPVNDIWIAAATLDCGAHLLTFDRHFEAVEGLDLTLL